MNQISNKIDQADRVILKAIQNGLPLTSRPYHAVAEDIGLEPGDVIARVKRLLSSGVIKRIGAVPNHYKLGVRSNGMTVWDVEDSLISEVGREIGELTFVSHCYHRPRHLPDWPYNLFAMVHGRNRSETEARAEEIAKVLGSRARAHEILYSTKILKKTGIRLVG